VPLPTTRATATSPSTIQAFIDARHLRHIADNGYSLIELMVALLILAILLSIAIPTILGTTRSANGQTAQANSNTALLASQSAFYMSGLQFQPTNSMIMALGASERNLKFQSAGSANHSQISVYVAPDQNGIILAAQSNSSKDCWYTIMNGRPEPSTAGTPYRTLPVSELATGTFFGEAKAPSTGAAPSCQSSAVLAARAGSVAYQRGRFPSL